SERSIEEEDAYTKMLLDLVCKDSKQPGILYRNISQEHYNQLRASDGIIRATTRTKTGNGANKAFNRFDVIYLCARLYDGQLPDISPYGKVQLSF
ncbi:hypothetical protein PFISCL1PPCAC_18495, partial [Pristionchus fissidentatus]